VHYVAMNAEAGGTNVTVEVYDTVPDVGPDACSYAASPADVIGLASGLPAAAFADFPIT
jgi:hypothetical protein